MGKTQSKRSVDITTDVKKAAGEGDEVAGKVEKIEDIDQKEASVSNAAATAVNGDASPQEKNDTEKKETPEEGSENDKDLTTEKNAEAAAAAVAGAVDGSGDNAAAPNTPEGEQKEGAATAAGAEEISPLTDDSKSNKTSSAKKDKVKKKWSFRSISFGKKDKQKPAKSDEATAAAAASAETAVTNGEAEKTEAVAKQLDEAAGGDANAAVAVAAADNDETKPTENGLGSEQEAQLNGDKTPSPTIEEKQQQQQQQPKKNEINESSSNTNNATEVTTIATPPPTPAAAAAAADSNNETSKDTAAVNAVETVTVVAATVAAAVETNAAPTHVSNGNAAADEVANVAAHVDESSSKASIPSVINNDADLIAIEKPQQNGTNGEAEHDAEPVAAPVSNLIELAADVEQIKIKSQIEVNNIISDDQHEHINANVDNDDDDDDDDSVKLAKDASTIAAGVSVTANAPAAVSAAVLDQTQSPITSDTFESSSIVPTTSSVTSTTITIMSDNVQVVQEISQEEEEAQVVASIIAAVSETPDDNATNATVATISTDFVEQQQQEQKQQTEGEGVNANNDQANNDVNNAIENIVDVPEELSPPPPPLPVSLPPSQVSVFAFNDNSETSNINETTDDNITTKIKINDNETLNDNTNVQIRQIDALPETTATDAVQIASSPVAMDSTTQEVSANVAADLMDVEETATQPAAVEALNLPENDFVIINETAMQAAANLAEDVTKAITKKVSIVEPEQTHVAERADDEHLKDSEQLLAVAKSAAEEFVTEITDKAGEMAMQKLIEAAAAAALEENEIEEEQRLPTPPPPTADELSTAASSVNEIVENTNKNMDKDMEETLIALTSRITLEDEPTQTYAAAAAAATTTKTNIEQTDAEQLHAGGDANYEQQQNVADTNVNVDCVVAAEDADADAAAGADADAVAVANVISPATSLDINNAIKGVIEVVTKQSDSANANIATTTYELEDDSSNKDIASAKDLMENVAAEITTQELTALTCE